MRQTSRAAHQRDGASHRRIDERLVPRHFVTALLLLSAAITIGWVYHPVLGASAIWLDDQQYVTDNQLVLNPSAESVDRFLMEVLHPSTVAGYYQPLTMISLTLDAAAGGGPGHLRAFHRTNLGLHIINSVLVIVLLILLFDEPYTAAMIGILFGIHPLTVEPVAWITERKTLLATCFALASLIAYVRYTSVQALTIAGADRRTRSRFSISRGGGWYLGAVIGYTLALLSKPTVTTLPALFLLLDFWPLNRLGRGAILEKLPFLTIGLVAGTVTILSQQNTAFIQYPTAQSWPAVLLVVCYNIGFYLSKMVWPGHLLGFYLRPDYHSAAPLSVTNPMLMAGMIGTAILVLASSISLRWTRAFMTGWLFYLCALLPTLGVIRVATVIVSEKYGYFPSLGLLLVMGWLFARCWSLSRGLGVNGRLLQMAMCVSALTLGIAEAKGTRDYLAIWHDNDALYGYVHTHSPQAWFLQSGLGDQLVRSGDVAEAAAHYLQAEADEETAGSPPHAALQQNLGNVLYVLDRKDEAIRHYRRALAIEPTDVSTMDNLALALEGIGKADEAFAMFRDALRADPADAVANEAVGRALVAQENFQEAIAHFRAAIQSRPEFIDAHINLAQALQMTGQLDASIAEYRGALQLAPNDSRIRNNLAAALLDQGLINEAIVQLQEAVRLNPTDRDIQGNLREALARLPHDQHPHQ